MMLNTNYSALVEQARSNGSSLVNFKKPDDKAEPVTATQDTFTLSNKAQAMLDGKKVEEIAPTYIKPETARELLNQNSSLQNLNNVSSETETRNLRFDDMMQSILDKNLGIDRDKLKEIEAMMEEIANNDNLSPEEKQKAMEELEKLKESIIEESLALKEQAKKTFNEESS